MNQHLEPLEAYKNISFLIQSVIKHYPEYEKNISKSFQDRSEDNLLFVEKLASLVVKLCKSDLEKYIHSYAWTCNMLLEEEFYFRANNKYRYSKLKDAIEQVYSNHDFMQKYMDGLLLSQVLWKNHSDSLYFFYHHFLNSTMQNIVEIGPGHGLLSYLAYEKLSCKLTCVDISKTSLQFTDANLKLLNSNINPQFYEHDISNIESLSEIAETKFDALILSEILEHNENPIDVLRQCKKLLKAGANVFVNIPTNCPAPDHIYYLDSIDDVIQLVQEAGYNVVQHSSYPMTGYKLEAAIKRKLTISHCLNASPN